MMSFIANAVPVIVLARCMLLRSGMQAQSITELRARTIVAHQDVIEAARTLRFFAGIPLSTARLNEMKTDLAAAEGAAAGTLFALREAEHDQAAAS